MTLREWLKKATLTEVARFLFVAGEDLSTLTRAYPWLAPFHTLEALAKALIEVQGDLCPQGLAYRKDVAEKGLEAASKSFAHTYLTHEGSDAFLAPGAVIVTLPTGCAVLTGKTETFYGVTEPVILVNTWKQCAK
jgi:hypothetical protein